jgi:outer membrane protein assembly factor BamB
VPSRRALLAAVGGGLVALAGCTDGETTPAPGGSPTETPIPVPTGTETPPLTSDVDRPTRTPRDPESLDVSGAWPQDGFDVGHGGVTGAAGVPDSAEPYWHLTRGRSGPVSLVDGRLLHFGSVGEDPSGPPTVTRTRPTGTSAPDGGQRALFCRSAADGRLLWTLPMRPHQRWPTVTEANVVVAGNGFVATYRVADGEEVWRQDLGERTATVSTILDGTILVSSQRLGTDDREADVRAYDATDGTHRWTRPSPKLQADLAAAGDTVVSLSSKFQVGSVLTARALGDGSERWSVELDDNGIPGGPYVAGETAYVAPDDGGVHAFDLVDGSRRWHYEAETPNVVGVAVNDDAVYLVDDGRLAVVAADDGSERWAVSPSGDAGYAGRPAVGSGTIYLERRGFPADVVALSRADGSHRWSHTLPETTVEGDMVTSGLAAQPTVAEDAVYAYAEDGLYAFGPER